MSDTHNSILETSTFLDILDQTFLLFYIGVKVPSRLS